MSTIIGGTTAGYGGYGGYTSAMPTYGASYGTGYAMPTTGYAMPTTASYAAPMAYGGYSGYGAAPTQAMDASAGRRLSIVSTSICTFTLIVYSSRLSH